MKQKVYVVQNTDLGWDSVVAVYTNEEAAIQYQEAYGDKSYYIVIRDMHLQDKFEE